MVKAKAFAPGHITGFFEIHENEDLTKNGSRGSGLNISMGVTTTVTVTPGEEGMTVFLNGVESDAKVTKDLIVSLLPDGYYNVKVESYFKLPVSQGFGVSGAAALSTGLALRKALMGVGIVSIGIEDVIRAAHLAEVSNRTGLGDVVAQVTGGFTIRKTPGLPPEENVLRVDLSDGQELKVVLCIVGEDLHTSEVLSDEDKRKKINLLGGMLVDGMVKEPSLDLLMNSSYQFVTETGLIGPNVKAAVEDVSELCPASMSCLGSSVFAITDSEVVAREVVDILSSHGKVFRCSVDKLGAREL